MTSIAGEDILELYPVISPTAPTGGNLFLYNKQNEAIMIRYPDGTDYPIHTANSKTITVAKSGNAMFKTLKAAVDYATSNGNGFDIDVQPGLYIENNPIQLGNGNSIESDSGPMITTIVAMNANSNLIECGGSCYIRGLRLVGCTGASAVQHNQTYGNLAISEIVASACKNGIESFGYPGITMVYNTHIACDATNGCYRGIWARGGAQIYGSTVVTQGYPTNRMHHCLVSEGVHTASQTRSTISFTVAWTAFSDEAIYVNDNGRIKFTSSSMNYNTLGIHIGPTGYCDMILRGTDMLSNTNDLQIDALDCKFVGNGVELDPSKVINPNNTKINVVMFSNELEEEGMVVIGNFNVGDPGTAAKSSFGEGAPYTRSMGVLHNTNLEEGSWTDKTNAAKFKTLPSFTLFAGTGAGNCTYIGSDYPFGGMKLSFESLGTDNDASKRIWEYWNGSAWTEMKIMVTGNTPPYYSYSGNIAIGELIINIRFGLKTNDMVTYGTKTINSITKYWVRVRVTDDLEANPLVTKTKIHSSHKKINNNGYTEYFGNSRPVAHFPWSLCNTEYSGTGLVDSDIYLSDSLNIKQHHNTFPTGILSRLCFNSLMPFEIDTSFPIKLEWSVLGTSDTDGDVYWIVRWGRSCDEVNIYQNSDDAPTQAAGEKSKVITQTITNKNVYLSLHDYLDISDMNFRNDNCSDSIWVSITRHGENELDTYPGDVVMIQLAGSFIKYCEGGFITMF